MQPVERLRTPIIATADSLRREQPDVLARYVAPTRTYIANLLNRESHPDLLSGMLRYQFGFVDVRDQPIPPPDTGKALRPTLCLLTADAVGSNWLYAVPAAASLEVFHNATLIHDDLQDGDQKRRGRPTVWTEFSPEQAINAGDAGLLLSLKMMSDLRHAYPAHMVLEAASILSETGFKITKGQTLDIDFEKRTNVRVEDYLQMIRLKTGLLIETAIDIGALLGGADQKTRESLHAYAEHLGAIFQKQDDYLGIWGDPKKTGKPVGADIKRRKKTLPIILGMQNASEMERQMLQRLYALDKKQLSDEEVQQVLTVLNSLSTAEQVRKVVESDYEQACSAIAAMSNRQLPRYRNDFLLLADSFAHREK